MISTYVTARHIFDKMISSNGISLILKVSEKSQFWMLKIGVPEASHKVMDPMNSRSSELPKSTLESLDAFWSNSRLERMKTPFVDQKNKLSVQFTNR